MSVLEFIASLVESLAWPAAALSAVLVLRVPISNAVEKRLRRAKFGSAEFEFDADKTDELIASVEGARVELEKEKVPSAQSPSPQSTHFEENHDRVVRLAELAELSPVGAFLSSFIELERTLRRLLSDYALSQSGWSPETWRGGRQARFTF